MLAGIVRRRDVEAEFFEDLPDLARTCSAFVFAS
jgi:hypothetical protein